LATIGAVISIYAFNPEVRISTQGLKFPLHDEPLMFGVRESTSNAASADRVHINVGGGPALLVRDLDEVRLYGFVLEQA
jgi:thiamine pyrophosphokinase